MVAETPSQRLTLPIAPLVAGVLGLAAAAGVALAPTRPLEELVMDSGLPALIAAAEPPLGVTARAVLALGTGGVLALFSWLALYLLLGARGITLRAGDADEDGDEIITPTVRRADAHPDAPPRPPLLATRDLGTPFLEVTARHRSADEAEIAEVVASAPVEQALPIDLDQPLAAFDPSAIPETPLAPPVLPPSLANVPVRRKRPAPTYAPGERFDVYELAPPAPVKLSAEPVRSVPSPVEIRLGESVLAAEAPIERIAAPETDATIHALLDRLERGVARRGIGPTRVAEPKRSANEHGLEEALETLRKMAMRA